MVINYEEYFEQAGLVDIQTAIPDVVVDLKYATADNFMGEILYPDLRKAYLLPHMISRLARVHARLQELKPGYRLVIYDAARPLSIQRRMFERVRGTPQEQYVANPYNEGGFHNYGMAVDLSILGNDGIAFECGYISLPEIQPRLHRRQVCNIGDTLCGGFVLQIVVLHLQKIRTDAHRSTDIHQPAQ